MNYKEDINYQKYLQDLKDQGYKLTLDGDGKLMFADYWHPELIVTKLFSK